MAEIKLFFLQIVIIAFLCILLCRKSVKMVLLTALAMIGLSIGVELLYKMFPHFADFFTLETMFAYVTRQGGYSSRGHAVGVDRLTAIPFVLEYFLHTGLQKAFGIGLGNADFSGFSFLTSDFYRQYGWTSYSFFCSSFVTLEIGIVGFILYLSYYLNYLRQAVSVVTPYKEEINIKQLDIILSLLAFMMIFSNQSMRLEASAYMINCVLAFPFVLEKKEKGNVDGSMVPQIRIKRPRIRFRLGSR